MKYTRILWDMPITVFLQDADGNDALANEVYRFFRHVDEVFNTFKPTSELSRVNRGEISLYQTSPDLRTVIALCEKTNKDTGGYFSFRRNEEIHPLGLVKGWAVHTAADILRQHGNVNFYIDAGGDIEVEGQNEHGLPWSVGIRHPFSRNEIVKKLLLTNCGIATSGTYARGNHIYNPFKSRHDAPEIVSLTVLGPNVYDADRFATAAFAMGKRGIEFIESMRAFEGYQIDARGIATFTSGFTKYVS